MFLRRTLSSVLLLFFMLTASAQDMTVRTGCRRGTPRPEGLVMRRGAPDSQPKQVGGNFYHGERHQLVVLAAFNDRTFVGDEDATLVQWNLIFNARNLTETPFRGSVHDYFYAQSYGTFDLTFDLEYVKVKGDAVKYASDADDDENSQYLVQDIMEQLVQNPTIDWSLYDWNGDGFINQLLIIYAGHGMNDTRGDNLIWPHQWWMSDHLKDGQMGVYCDPIPVTYNDKEYKVDCYCALAELTKDNDYGSFGTICHEYTHCFGFPDFYNGSTKYVGSWDLMDYGNYNGDGYCPAGYSAHERWMMGWLTPTELSTTTTITNMPTLSDEPQAYLIRNDGHQDEYYIIENRQQIGWDAGLPGSGIIIFHVDYDPDLWVSTIYYPNTYSNKHYIIIPANNIPSASSYIWQDWAYPYNDNDSLTNNSEPPAVLYHENTDGTMLMNKSLYDMAVVGDLASFRFVVSTPTGILERKAEGVPKELYRMGPVGILRYPNGETKKVVKP